MQALKTIDDWGAGHATAGVTRADEVLGLRGPAERVFRWASVTKLATAVAVLTAVEEGVVELDEPAGPPGATVRHLLAHASGLPFEGEEPIGQPGERRIYSNTGFEQLGHLVAERAETAFAEYVDAAVFTPLEMSDTQLEGSPAADAFGPLTDLLRLAQELLAPTLLAAETLAEATSVVFPGLGGVLPGIGRQEPMDWGLGFELKDAKEPHWTGTKNSPQTFGHFGGSGTFLWVDPALGLACACLTDRDFGDWALEAWPALSDAVCAEAAAA